MGGLHAIWAFLLHVTGSDNTSGEWYGFWSGFAGDIPLFAGFGVLYHKFNCHEDGCWRVGRHHHEASGQVVCKKHLIERRAA